MSSQSLSDMARFMLLVDGGVHVLLFNSEVLLWIGVDVNGVDMVAEGVA